MAFIKDNQVCLLSPLEARITAIQINSDSLHKIFDDKPVYVSKGECLPVFGFKFTSGERYNFAYDVQSDKSESHLVTAEFSYPKEEGGRTPLDLLLQVTSTIDTP